MTQWKKAVRTDAKIDAKMPECFALLSRNAFAQWVGGRSFREADELELFYSLLRNVQSRISWAFAATSATEKRHQLYGAISVIMVMLSEIEGKWRGKEAAK